MSEIEKCCGRCVYYNGDMRDKNAFCDEREEFVSRGYFCYRYYEKIVIEENFDLESHDSQIRADERRKFAE